MNTREIEKSSITFTGRLPHDMRKEVGTRTSAIDAPLCPRCQGVMELYDLGSDLGWVCNELHDFGGYKGDVGPLPVTSRWEYKQVDVDFQMEREDLATLGFEGWQHYQTTHLVGIRYRHWFKRPMPPHTARTFKGEELT